MGSPTEAVEADLRRRLTTVLETADPSEGLWHLVTSGALDTALPEVGQLAMEQDPVHRHKDVLAHTIAVTSNTPPRLRIRMAALLHDIGKPATRRFGPHGVTFRYHEAVGARITTLRLSDLGYDADLVGDVARLVELSGRFHGYQLGWSAAAVRRYARDAGVLLGDLNTLVRCDCTTRDDRKVAALQRRMDDLERRIRDFAIAEREANRRPVLGGADVMDLLSIGPGPDIGRALAMLLDHEQRHGRPSHQEAADLVRQWHAAECATG